VDPMLQLGPKRIIQMANARYRCPGCDSEHFDSIQSAATDGELLECQSCKRVYEVKYGPDGTAQLVSL